MYLVSTRSRTAQSTYQFVNPAPTLSAAKTRISNPIIQLSNAANNSKIQKQNTTSITKNAASSSTVRTPACVHITATRGTVGQLVGNTSTRTLGSTNHNQAPEPHLGSCLSSTTPLQCCNSCQNCISSMAQRQILQQWPGARHHLQRHRFPSTWPTSNTATPMPST